MEVVPMTVNDRKPRCFVRLTVDSIDSTCMYSDFTVRRTFRDVPLRLYNPDRPGAAVCCEWALPGADPGGPDPRQLLDYTFSGDEVELIRGYFKRTADVAGMRVTEVQEAGLIDEWRAYMEVMTSGLHGFYCSFERAQGYDLPFRLRGLYNLSDSAAWQTHLQVNLGGGRRLLMDGDGNVTAEKDMGPGEVRIYGASREVVFNAIWDLGAPAVKPPVTPNGLIPF
jgi:hypothetical protein